MRTQNCTKCNINKPLVEFQIRKDTKNGYRKDCKYCQKKSKSNHYFQNKEEINLKCKQYYKENKEAINTNKKVYWQIHYLNNREYYLGYQSKYRENNKYLCNDRINKWAKTERGKSMKVLKEGKRRALKKSSCDNTININNTQLLFNQQGGVCNYCGIDLVENPKHLDHIIPLSKGGPHSILNVQRLCVNCNLRKSNKL